MALEDASDREEIFEVLLRAARSKARFTALLSIHADHIRGRRAITDDKFDGSRVEGLRIPRNSVPAFEDAIRSRTPSVGVLTSSEPFVEGLLEMLGGAAATALVLPITVGTRTVALIVAHRGTTPIALDEVADLFPLVTASSPALARVLASRSKAAASSRPVRTDTSAGYDVEVIIPNAAKKRTALDALRKAEAWEELVDSIRELIRDGMDTGDPDEDEQLGLLLELGRIEADRLGRPDRAIEAWRSAQSIDAGDDRVLDALEALFVQQGSWLDCVDLLEKRTALAEDPQKRITMLLNLAAMAHERLDDDERAAAAYERVLNWEPDHEVASRELESLYWSRKEWEPLAALLLDRASRQEDPEKSIVALESVAQMYEDKVGDTRAAFLVWLAVVRREPGRPHPLGQLDRLGPIANAWDEVTAECSSLAEELEAAHPEAAAQVWQLVGRWTRDHLANRDEAVRALDRAVRLRPSDSETLGELFEILRGDGRWMDLVGVLSERAEAEPDHRRRSELYAELGNVYDTHLHQPADAITFYERARALEPDSVPVLIALHRLYLGIENWDQLGEVLPRLIAVIDPVTQRELLVDLHVELGTVLADHLGKPEEAVSAFSDALAFEPKHAAAFRGIQRVHQATGQTEALLDATEAEIDAAGRADQLQRYGAIATAWHERARFDRAVAVWQKLLGLEPNSVVAQRGLVGSLRGNEQWGSLTVAQRALLAHVTDPAERIALLVDLASVLDTRLDDVDGAIAEYREVVGLDAKHRVALDALARLFDRAEQVQPAIEVLTRLLELTPDAKARADLFQRLGHVHLNARDLVNARLNLSQAIGLDLENPRAHEGMARLHLLQDELVPAGEELIRAAQLSPSQHDKIRCLADAAWVFRHRLRDVERARQCLHLILELEPEHADAKQALAELLQDAQQWETLWPHLEEQVQRAKDDPSIPAKERNEVYLRAARCAVELGRFPTAMELYDLAAASDPSPVIMIERAEALHRSKNLEAAAASFQTIVLRHAQAIERPQLAGVYRRLAEIHTALGKASQAQLFHQKVLDIDPSHRATHADLAELHLSRLRFDEAIASLRAVAAVAPLAEKIACIERIGDVYRDKLRNVPRAMSTYLEALELDSANRRILQRLLDLQSEGGQWKAAVETIGRFLEHETDPARRAAYYLASAEIRRTELKDRTGALEYYENALDELLREQPLGTATRARALEAFRIIDELVTAEKNWKLLEQTYRRMIKRMPKDDPVLLQLWDALGEIYRTRLQHYQSAIEAFEIAHALDTGKSPQRARVLSELYAAVGTQQPQQVSQRAAKLVETDPTNPDAYRALGRTSLEAGRTDEAWCVARALVFLKKANSEEEALYKRYQAHETRKATGILDEDSWAFVRHADEDRTISAMFALAWEAIVPLRAGPPKSFDLKSKDRMPVEDGTRVIAKIFRHASRVLNVALPDVYVQPRRSGRLMLANCVERGRLVPAVIVGRDLMTGYRDTEIAASVGALLALLRPAYYLKLTLATIDELEAVIVAAAQLVGKPGVGRPQLGELASTFAGEMQKRLTRSTGEALHGLVQRLPEQLDLARWRNAVDAAAQRAGLLVCGELVAAARMVSSESSALGLRPLQRVQDLVSYSVSPSYFSARRHLGIAVG